MKTLWRVRLWGVLVWEKSKLKDCPGEKAQYVLWQLLLEFIEVKEACLWRNLFYIIKTLAFKRSVLMRFYANNGVKFLHCFLPGYDLVLNCLRRVSYVVPLCYSVVYNTCSSYWYSIAKLIWRLCLAWEFLCFSLTFILVPSNQTQFGRYLISGFLASSL